VEGQSAHGVRPVFGEENRAKSKPFDSTTLTLLQSPTARKLRIIHFRVGWNAAAVSCLSSIQVVQEMGMGRHDQRLRLGYCSPIAAEFRDAG
jgi:hypothetical protein